MSVDSLVVRNFVESKGIAGSGAYFHGGIGYRQPESSRAGRAGIDEVGFAGLILRGFMAMAEDYKIPGRCRLALKRLDVMNDFERVALVPPFNLLRKFGRCQSIIQITGYAIRSGLIALRPS